MPAIPLLWIAERLSTATRTFPVPLLAMSRKLLNALTIPKHGHTPLHAPRAPRPASTYLMLVESDVQHGMRGILP